MTDYLSKHNNCCFQTIEESEKEWVDFISKGGTIITDDNSWFNGFQKMKDGRYCFMGVTHLGESIYKVF